MFSRYIYNKSLKRTIEVYNDAEIVSACLWLLKEHQLKTIKNNKNSDKPELHESNIFIRGFHTNGNDWKLFEIQEKTLKKTDFFKPNTNSLTNRIYRPLISQDLKCIESVIGLIRYACLLDTNMPYYSSYYKLSSDSPHSIMNKDAVQQLDDNIPNLLETVKDLSNVNRRINYSNDNNKRYIR